MLAATGVKFCNSGLRTHKEFVDLKEKQGKLLFGQLPILELDNHVFTQSASMVEYLAKRANLCGKDLFEETRCSEIAGAVRDCRISLMARIIGMKMVIIRVPLEVVPASYYPE